MGVEVEFVVYGDAEVFCCVGELKGGVVYVKFGLVGAWSCW